MTRRRRSFGPDPIDVHVGTRVRLRRTLLGMSQEKLGDSLGLTFQQVQKYERGANRIGASRLWQLGQVLDVAVSFFFDDMPGTAPAKASDDGLLMRRETLELVRAYYRIPSVALRHRVFDLTKSIARAGEVVAQTSDNTESTETPAHERESAS